MSKIEDRELLELAAKAAGCALAHAPHDHAHCGVLMAEWDKARNTPYWSPLTDDGDALRLAVRLGFGVTVDDPDISVIGQNGRVIYQQNAPSPIDATRRAIVRAAAEIGRLMC